VSHKDIVLGGWNWNILNVRTLLSTSHMYSTYMSSATDEICFLFSFSVNTFLSIWSGIFLGTGIKIQKQMDTVLNKISCSVYFKMKVCCDL
jgi:hypothetical protein